MLIIDDPVTWPSEVRAILESSRLKGLLQNHEWLDDIESQALVRNVCERVDDFSRINGVACYHFTKELDSKPYSAQGLRPLNFTMHHEEFLTHLQSEGICSESLYREIESRLIDWRVRHTGDRNGLLAFCLLRQTASDSSAHDLFHYYGGEAIYRAFPTGHEALQLLKSMGRPVVVEAKISRALLRPNRDNALGRSLISYFAQSMDSTIGLEFSEARVTQVIPPAWIKAVYDRHVFVEGTRKAYDIWSTAKRA